MGKVYDGIDDGLAAFVQAQPVWFVATAPLAADGHVNVSPRGHDCLSVLAPHRVAWVDDTGSGVETAAHLRENGRIDLPDVHVVRTPPADRAPARAGERRAAGHPGLRVGGGPAPPAPRHAGGRGGGRRALSDSCGDGVPVMAVVVERDLRRLGADKRGPDGLQAYRAAHNTSIDGLPGLPVSS